MNAAKHHQDSEAHATVADAAAQAQANFKARTEQALGLEPGTLAHQHAPAEHDGHGWKVAEPKAAEVEVEKETEPKRVAANTDSKRKRVRAQKSRKSS